MTDWKEIREALLIARTGSADKSRQKGLASTPIVSGASIPADEPSRSLKTQSKTFT
jgi:hypothetical protein